MRQAEVGDIGACDEQNQPNSQQQESEGLPVGADRIVSNRRDLDAPAAVGLRKFGLGVGSDRRHLLLRLSYRHAGLEARKDCIVAGRAVLLAAGENGRHPQIWLNR